MEAKKTKLLAAFGKLAPAPTVPPVGAAKKKSKLRGKLETLKDPIDR